MAQPKTNMEEEMTNINERKNNKLTEFANTILLAISNAFFILELFLVGLIPTNGAKDNLMLIIWLLFFWVFLTLASMIAAYIFGYISHKLFRPILTETGTYVRNVCVIMSLTHWYILITVCVSAYHKDTDPWGGIAGILSTIFGGLTLINLLKKDAFQYLRKY